MCVCVCVCVAVCVCMRAWYARDRERERAILRERVADCFYWDVCIVEIVVVYRVQQHTLAAMWITIEI